MIILRKRGQHLLAFVDDNIIAYNYETGSQRTMKILDPPVENLTKSTEEVLKLENRKVSSAFISESGDMLVITLLNKQLVVYDRDFNVVCNILTNRAASKARCTNQNEVIVADKTGDIFLYKLIEGDKPELLLGHLSMVLDVILSDCRKYVITCDRDDKIRVSCYPNAYNIMSYCLGHDEFVTNLEISHGVLISASGDGTIRFWDFSNGKQLIVINTNDHVQDKSAVEKFCKEMDDEKVEVSVLPIVDMQIYQNDATYIGVTLLGFNGLQLYRMATANGALDVQYIESIRVHSNIIAFSLSQHLFILTNHELLMYNLRGEKFTRVNSEEINGFYDTCKSLFSKYNVSHNISTLYKRKYDNVQEYMDRKKLRLEGKS